jgi:FkbM family methyltransferase
MKKYTFKVATKNGIEVLSIEGNPKDDSFRVSNIEAGSEYDVTFEDFSEPTTVIDIGAGYGEFALQSLALGAKQLICVEPNNDLIPYLQSNLNKYTPIIFNSAVIDYIGNTELLLMNTRTAAGSVMDVQYDLNSERSKLRESKDVSVIHMNYLLERVVYENIVLKIDAEGCEYKIIKDLMQSKYINKIKKIYIEYYDDIIDIISDLKSIGFESIIVPKDNRMGMIISKKVEKPVSTHRVDLITFGFKYGHPKANYYFDVSFLKNPVRQTGTKLSDPFNDKMMEFIESQPEATKIVNIIVDLIKFLISIDADTAIGIGCNSGKHRSRAIAEIVQLQLKNDNIYSKIFHRDI